MSEDKPDFNVFVDPKCDWALRHLEQFPVEVMRADYETLLKVPGIGYKSASRIVKARRLGSLDYAALKKMGVVLKRAIYFITCGGRQMYPTKLPGRLYFTEYYGWKGEAACGVKVPSYEQLSFLMIRVFSVRIV